MINGTNTTECDEPLEPLPRDVETYRVPEIPHSGLETFNVDFVSAGRQFEDIMAGRNYSIGMQMATNTKVYKYFSAARPGIMMAYLKLFDVLLY